MLLTKITFYDVVIVEKKQGYTSKVTVKIFNLLSLIMIKLNFYF